VETALLALSPLDGRYAASVAALRPYLSEFGLIRYRVQVELAWLEALARHPQIEELPAPSEAALAALQALNADFSPTDAAEIKQIEATTRHDVKAVEYWIKQRLHQDPWWAAHYEFVHFACTSEDINNLAYALMLKHARDQVMLPALDQFIERLGEMANSLSATPNWKRSANSSISPVPPKTSTIWPMR